MKKVIALLLVFLLAFSSFLSASISVFAAESASPLSIEIITDKESYNINENIAITVKIKNLSKSDIERIVIVPSMNQHFLSSDSATKIELDKLKPNETKSASFTAVISRNAEGLNFFQRIILFFRYLFGGVKTKPFDNISFTDKSCLTSSKEVSQSKVNDTITASVWYQPQNNEPAMIEATTIDTVSSALSNLIKEQMEDDSFDSYTAEQNDFYSGRILLKGKNVDLENCDAETIIAGPDDTYIIQFDSPAKAIAFQAEQSGKANIEFAEPDTYVRIDPIERKASVYDSSYASSTFNSWGVEHIEADVFANYLSNNNYDSEIVVAVVDSGVDNTHPYLAGKLVSGYDYVDDDGTPYEDYHGSGHGTHVSGTIIDCTPALNVKIMPVRVLGLGGNGYTSAVAYGIEYAASHNAKIINLSLGGKHNELKEDAIEYAINQGATVCVAAGNEYDNTAYHCPSHITTNGCICVSAIDSSNIKADFSNSGSAVDIGAPGVCIKSCVPGGLYDEWDGTSMATPHVSACAAMIKLLNPSASPSQIENYIRQYTQDIGTSGRDNYFGYGVPKMSKAIPKTNYTVTYNANGGSVSPASTSVESGSSVSLPTPTRRYTITYNANNGTGAPSNQNLNAGCKGWSTSFSATSASYNCGSSYTPMSSITLYAVWDNATGYVTATEPTRSGYSFAGWATSSSDTAVEYTPGSSISIDRNITLYAVWSKNPNTYTIIYNANGGSNPPASQIKTENIDLVLSTIIPTRTGYNFLGWSTSSSATSATYFAGDTYSANSSATLYAVWEIKTYTISYNANGGSTPPSSQTKTYGQNLTLSSSIPSRTGYDFLGWSTSSSATSATYSAGGTYTANSSATLYAVWRIKTYVISYNPNAGSDSVSNMPSAQTKTHDKNLTISSNVPVRSGYNFWGYSTDRYATRGTYYPDNSAYNTYSNNESVTLYAIWEKQEVILSSYSGSISTSKTQVTVTNDNYGDSCEYFDGSYTGYKVPLPNVTVVRAVGIKDSWVCQSTPWQIVSGDAVLMNSNGVVYLVVKRSGTVKLRYWHQGVCSDIYTYNITLT